VVGKKRTAVKKGKETGKGFEIKGKRSPRQHRKEAFPQGKPVSGEKSS